MSSQEIKRYVVTFHYAESGLADILELNSAMVNGGFSTSLNDEEGKPHELGTNSFGIVSALSADELKAHAQGLAEVALENKPDAEVETLEAFLSSAARKDQA